MDCGICVDVCPTDALAWVPDTLAPTVAAGDLTLGKQALSDIAVDSGAEGNVAHSASDDVS